MRPQTEDRPDPNDKTVYVFDWTAWLAGASIASHTVALSSPAGKTAMSVDDDQVIASNTQVRIRVVGGQVLGASETPYRLTCRIVTSEVPTREKEESIYLRPTDN